MSPDLSGANAKEYIFFCKDIIEVTKFYYNLVTSIIPKKRFSPKVVQTACKTTNKSMKKKTIQLRYPVIRTIIAVFGVIYCFFIVDSNWRLK